MDTEQLKVPPHSIEAEQSVLGGLMLDNQAWFVIADKIAADDFYRRDHQLIFLALKELAEADRPLDIITVSEHLGVKGNGRLEAIGGLAYLGGLAKNTPSAANIGTYADIVKERAVMRQLIKAGADIAESGFEPEGRSIEQLVDNAQNLVFKIGEQDMPNQGGFVDVDDILRAQVDLIDHLFHSDADITGLATGYKDIDKMTLGLQPSDLIIIAGRPSHGKTTLAMNIAEHAAVKDAKNVAVFSMEMPAQQLGMRLSASVGKIPLTRLRSGKLEDEDWPKYTAAIAQLKGKKILIDDSPALSPSQVRTRCRRLMRNVGQLDLVVIDYIQLMVGNRSNDTRAGELDDISRGLKALAKELQVPVIALAQLNRSIEQRPDKRPRMSDLRDSGGLEANADMIAFVYRDEVYDEDTPDKGTAEIIIGKQRNGPIGTVRLAFIGEYTRFENFSRDCQ